MATKLESSHKKDKIEEEKLKNPVKYTENNKVQLISTKCKKYAKKLPKLLEKLTGHKAENFTTMEKFIKFMHQPTDAASLGVGRMLFGEFLSNEGRPL